MKITAYASAAVIALAMSIGSATAEDQETLAKDIPGSETSAALETPFSLLGNINSATPMTEAQLDQTVGGNGECSFRRRWFHRKKYAPQVNGCNPD